MHAYSKLAGCGGAQGSARTARCAQLGVSRAQGPVREDLRDAQGGEGGEKKLN